MKLCVIVQPSRVFARRAPHFSKSAQPASEVRAIQQQLSAGRWRHGVREHLSEGPALEIDISAGIPHSRVQACVTEPMTDGCEVDTGLEQGNGRAVPDRVWMKLLVLEEGATVDAFSTYRRRR